VLKEITKKRGCQSDLAPKGINRWRFKRRRTKYGIKKGLREKAEEEIIKLTKYF
jgi:hypothetical protein